MKTLRPHQDRAMALLRQSLGRGNRRPMLQAPTGFGKTALAAAIVRSAVAKGNRVIFCVPALSLIDQTVREFYADGITQIGVLQGQHELTNPAMPVQVASVQTLARRRIPDADLVVVDEAHKWFKFYGEWMTAWDAVPFVGLSATPWTKGLGKHYDDLIIAATTQELIDKGYLSNFRVFAPSHPDLSDVKTVAGDYHEGELAGVMGDAKLVADAVKTWLALAENRPTLCFAVDRAHAKKLSQRFESAGVPTGYIDAYTSTEEREVVRQKFQAGEIRVVCNVGCLTTGVDWDVRCISLCRPTKSEILFTQIIGRGLRTADGKDDCLILDHSDTHLELGFVTDIHHEKLNDGKAAESASAAKDEPKPKECQQCHFVKPAKVHQCPACGFAPEKISHLEEAEGKLEELKPGGKVRKADKQEFYSALVTYAAEKGRASGWVSHTYRDYFGVWPKGMADVKGPIIADAANFIKHKNIAFAKRRRAA